MNGKLQCHIATRHGYKEGNGIPVAFNFFYFFLFFYLLVTRFRMGRKRRNRNRILFTKLSRNLIFMCLG